MGLELETQVQILALPFVTLSTNKGYYPLLSATAVFLQP